MASTIKDLLADSISWNPVTGCSKTSPGCRHCYAERMALRLQGYGMPKYARGFEVTLHEDVLDKPLKMKKPHRIFVNSMSDLFHECVPADFIQRVFAITRQANWHVYQMLTKRSERLLALDPEIEWPGNVWMGVTVEREDYLYRVEHLRRTHAKTKFLCLEPLLGPLSELDLSGIDWVILGGESGTGARPMCEEWATEVRDKCVAAEVPFFFKQWGGVARRKAGRLLQGEAWEQMPER